MHEVTATLLGLLLKSDISHYIIESPYEEVEKSDLGLRVILAQGRAGYSRVQRLIEGLGDKCLYFISDDFYTDYAVFRLPGETTDRWLSIGPVLINRPDGRQILSMLGKLRLPDSLYHEVSLYYGRLPEMKSMDVFRAICFAVADTVFGSRDKYTVRYILHSEESEALQKIISDNEPLIYDSGKEKFENVRRRYELENIFLKAVLGGNTQEALHAFNNFMNFVNELIRMPDRLRDMKDLCITHNTLLRKAAEEAGVPPLYIDAYSNSNIARIEQCANEIETDGIYRELIEGYCELIRNHALNAYSELIQNAILIINASLQDDLSLTAVADRLNVTRTYLSTRFCKETGHTLSAYVLDKRLSKARHLLASTPLSVQEIAWEVGISDPNYFSRLFRRENGISPKEYRIGTRI